MAEGPQSLRTLFSSAEEHRKQLDSSWETSSQPYQENLRATIATYEDCKKLADELSLFSPNETLEDISSKDIQYSSNYLTLPLHFTNAVKDTF
jgi:hypothetical protein